MMAMPDYVMKKRLEELWKQIEKTHFSYLDTDDSPEKLKERQKLEGYILDYLCIIPHEYKFSFPETLSLMTRSAHDPEFNGYRLARGWAALGRYASNLLAQPWRKEYRTLKLYSGFFKHEVEGSGLIKVEEILNVMGYKRDGNSHSLSLDGPVCPTQVTGVSLDSLIAYVECQIMIQIWEEVSRRGSTCSWLEILKCRESYAGNVDRASTLILQSQRNPLVADIPCSDIYSNVKVPSVCLQSNNKKYLPYQSSSDTPDHMLPMTVCNNAIPDHMPHMQLYDPHYVQPNTTNGYIQNGHINSMVNSIKPPMHPNECNIQNMPDEHGMYCINPMMMNQMNPMYRYHAPNMMTPYNPMGGYMYQPIPPHPYIMQAPVTSYGPIKQATTLPLTNGYHCPTVPNQGYCSSVPTGQLIELDMPSYPSNSHNALVTSPKQSFTQDQVKMKTESNFKSHAELFHKKALADNVDLSVNMKKAYESSIENQENIRRNSAPKSTGSFSSDHTFSMPRSDTQPSLSKAREDGMGTFESWDYVFRNLENQGYSKDLGERDNQMPSALESKTLGRTTSRDPKRYQQTTMDLEDALLAMSLEKDTDEEMYRTAKINETLMKLKQENEAKAAKANMKKQIRADEREKRKSSSYEASNSTNVISENNAYNRQSDKTRLIPKEDAKDKKEMDKNVILNGNSNKVIDGRKIKKSVVKCLSSETDTINHKRKSPPPERMIQNGAVSKKAISQQVNLSHHNSSHQQSSKASQDTVDSAMKSRLVVTLHSPEKSTPSNKSHSSTNGALKKGESIVKNGLVHNTDKSNNHNKAEIWECAACTYVNRSSKNICEMCSKSRQIGVESVPLMSGGKECPACTLVNNKDATICAVCEASLKHSPTYI